MRTSAICHVFYTHCPMFQFCSMNIHPQRFSWKFKDKISLTLLVPCISESCIDIKIKLNFYFRTSLWCLKRFYEGCLSGIGTGRVNCYQYFTCLQMCPEAYSESCQTLRQRNLKIKNWKLFTILAKRSIWDVW